LALGVGPAGGSATCGSGSGPRPQSVHLASAKFLRLSPWPSRIGTPSTFAPFNTSCSLQLSVMLLLCFYL